MSWKYQFYGVGAATTLRAFTQGNIVNVEKYDVHYLKWLKEIQVVAC